MASENRTNEKLKNKNEKMRNEGMRKYLAFFFFPFSIFFFLFSCKTTAKVSDAGFDNASALALEKGADVYMIADVNRARPLVNLLPVKELKDNQTKQMLDRTNFLAAALFPKESGRNFQLVAWGNFPSTGVEIAFGMTKGWEKKAAATGYSYWRSNESGLSIAVNPKQAFIVASSGAAVEPVTVSADVTMPKGFVEFRKNEAGETSPFSFWLNEGAGVVNQILNSSGVQIRFPVKELFVVFFPAEEGQYRAMIRMHFENASQARGMAGLLAMANNYIFGELGGKSLLTAVFFSSPPVVNGSHFDIKTAVLKEAEIVQLFGLFSLN